MRNIEYKSGMAPPINKVVELYTKLHWSSADKPDVLEQALENSHHVVSAWKGDTLIGIANAISDGALVVYYPHLAVDPDYQKQGIGRKLMEMMSDKYSGFHQQQVVADKEAVDFYKKCGFVPSGSCKAMWIYQGKDHE